jgi:hypothetical protein
VKAKRVTDLDPTGPLVENAARIIAVRLGEMRDLAPAALRPASEHDQHDLRIAAKRLRYVLEATEFCFGEPAKAARGRARDLQEVLGELRDCDQMEPQVGEQVERLRRADAAALRQRVGDRLDADPAAVATAPNRNAYRGLELLRVHLIARRELLFDRFVQLWAEIERERTWDELEAAGERRLAERSA